MLCKNPKLVFNKYLGHNVYVPCGYCSCCLIRKSERLRIMIQNECDKHTYNIFFTLTYDNTNIPCICRSDFPMPANSNISVYRNKEVFSKFEDLDIDSCEVDCVANSPSNIYKKVGRILIADEKYLDFLAIPFKKDVQDFLKRIRRKLYYDSIKDLNINSYDKKTKRSIIDKVNETIKLRYVVVSEYGTKNHRPHYHGIFHTNSKNVARWLLQNIPTCWKFCDWTAIAERKFHGRSGLPSLVEKSCSSYVSSYICSAYYKFPLSKLSFAKPFVLFSRRPIYGLSTFDEDIAKKVIDGVDYSFVKTKQISNGNSVDVECSSRIESFLFGRFEGIDKLSDEDIIQIILRPIYSLTRPQQRFVTKVKRLIKKFVGVVNTVTIADYVRKVRAFFSRFRSFKLYSQQLSKFSVSNYVNYVKFNYQTFACFIHPSTYYNKESYAFSVNLFNFIDSIGFSIFSSRDIFDIIFHPFDVFIHEISIFCAKYQNRLFPKHSHSFNINYYETI